MFLEHDFIEGQRAGFIGAKNVHRPEVLNGVQALDDDFLFRHGNRALGEIDRDNHGQHLRRQADCDRKRKKQGLNRIAIFNHVNQKNNGDEPQHHPDHEPDKTVNALFEIGLLADGRQPLGDFAELGFGAGLDHKPDRGSADHAGTHKRDIALLDGAGAGRLRRGGCFFHGERFAGQRSLIDEEVFAAEDAQIRGDHVAGVEIHDIAGHELAHFNFSGLAVAENGGRRPHKFGEFFSFFFGTVFLNKGKRNAEQDHDKNERGFDFFTEDQ